MYSIPDTVLAVFLASPHLPCRAFSKVDIIMFPVLLARKLRHREVNQHVLGHTARKGQSWNLTLMPQSQCLTTVCLFNKQMSECLTTGLSCLKNEHQVARWLDG